MPRKNFIISVLTIFVQYYDYHLFGFLASSIASYFFPADDSIKQLLNAYFLMTVAMVAKPIGALFFGKIGDIYGRSNSFKISLFGTAIASIIISIIPSYQSIGLLSAFTLLLCRMIICAFASSGSDGVRIYIYEHIDKSKQCFGVGITTVFTMIGSFIASLSAWFFTLGYFPDYSWKFAFLLGGVFGLLVILAMKIVEFSDTNEIKTDSNFEKYKEASIGKIIKSNWKLFIFCTMTAGAIGSTNQFLIIFFGTYNFTILKTIDQSSMQSYISIAIFIYMIFSLLSGYIADRIDRYFIIIIASVSATILSICLSISLSEMIFNHYIYLAISATMPFITMPAAAILKQSIPLSIRYRLFSLSHAVGSVILSAPTAYLSALLYDQTHISWLPITYFVIMIIIISISLGRLNKRCL